MNQRFGKVINANQLIDEALKRPASTLVTEGGDVMSAEPLAAELTSDMDMPWANANPRIISYVQIRMPEPLKLKLEWLHARQLGQAKQSQHAIALAALEREIDRLVAKARKGVK